MSVVIGITRNLIVDGKNLADFGIYVSSLNTYNAPERDIDSVEVLGRNGELTIDNKRYKNIEVAYPCILNENFKENIDALRNYLYSKVGYVRIEDDFNPHEYRLGRVTENFKIKPKIYDNAGVFEITFDCRPERFLKSGERAISVSNGGVLKNPTLFNSKPLIRVYGTGAITINGQTITVNSANQYTDIDCEMMNCYKGSTNCNGNVTMTTGDFPTLKSGNNTVTYSGFTSVEIAPRWWKL